MPRRVIRLLFAHVPSLCLSSRLAAFSRHLSERKGCGRAAASFAAGIAAALALPPTGLVPVLWVSFPVLILLLRTSTRMREAFLTGWCFAFGYFLLGLYWIAAAMFVDIRQFWWGVPLAAAGLPAFFALYYGIGAAIAHKMGLEGLRGAWIFALIWFLTDMARSALFTGFPWNLEGYAWVWVLPVMQATSVIGIHGLTLLTLLAACLPAALTNAGRLPRWAVAGSLLAFGLIGVAGALRLSAGAAPLPGEGARVRIVQPNIEQATKWVPEEREKHFQTLLDLSFAPSVNRAGYIIWPETASTFYLEEDFIHRFEIASRLQSGQKLLVGGIRREAKEDGTWRYYNSLLVLGRDGGVEASYDKHHLVPFGEYLPGRKYLPAGMRTLAALGVDFNPGPGIRTFHIPDHPSFSPLICYEAIFPGQVADSKDRPEALINITNDGWYGRTAGPWQHFAIARVRAIEEGIPLLRAANTGISVVTDGAGRIVAKLGLGKTGVVDAYLPRVLEPTLYSQWGMAIVWGLFALACAGCAAAGRCSERKYESNSVLPD